MMMLISSSGGTIILVAIFSILLIGFIDLFIQEPNRCEMTYMYQYPEYVEIDMERNLRKMFPNYHLYVYGEGQYAETLRLNEFNGQPIIFVPGNAGSYKQVRSLASVGLLMSAHKGSHLNYFSIDLNEELSAFIGDKLERQTRFLYHSIRRICDLYKHVPNIRLILIGHSIGGILIRSLLTRNAFRPFLSRISIVLTLSTPNLHPAIGYSLETIRFYERTNLDYQRYRNTRLSDLNFITIGGSYQDLIVRPDLIRLDSSTNPKDLSILTTAIPDVWVSADHLCIVWCRQLMIKLNRMFFDLIDLDQLVFVDNSDKRQKIIDYHLLHRHYSKEYPSILPSSNLSISLMTSTKIKWIELKDRLVRLSFVKIVRPINYVIRLKDGEMIVIYLEGNLKPDTISIGNCQPSTNTEPAFECNGNIYTVTLMTQSVPNLDSKWDSHVGRFDADQWLAKGFTHLIINLIPSQSSRYVLIIDRFTRSIRQRTIQMPNSLSSFQSNPFVSKLMFSKLISQEQLYYELTLENFNNIWHSYWLVVRTTSCYQNDSKFNGFLYLNYPSNPELNEFIWPLQPIKNSLYQFGLSRHTNSLDDELNVGKNRPKIYLFVEPNCGFDFQMKFSITGSIAQLLRHYFSLIVPMIISIIILILSIQFSNLCNRYTFSNSDLEKFRTFVSRNDFAGKCYQFQTASELMIQRHYFAYCFVQVVPASLFALFIIKQMYPSHDLINLANITLGNRTIICIILFLFAYSIIYLASILVTHLANNFSNGLIFFRIRCFQNFSIFPIRWIGLERLASLIDIGAVLVFINTAIYFLPLTYCLIHFYFTISMLYWFYQAKSVELRLGRTTSTTLIFAIYPLLFLLLLAITLLHLPYCIDWIFGQASIMMTINNKSNNMLNLAMKNLSNIYLEDFILLLLLTILMAMFHSNPLDLQRRFYSYHSNRTQKIFNILLLMISFITMIIGSLIWESIRITITIVLTLITIGHFRHHLWNMINININDDDHFNIDHTQTTAAQQQQTSANIKNDQQKLFKSE